MYRVWYSTESFADFVIDHTMLSKHSNIIKNKMYESDANNPTRFHTMPDHIRRIMYLDAPDLIVEVDNEPIFSIEVTTEAGTGHNAFQRFARIAAAVENSVPAFYIYPEGAIITRKAAEPKWDTLNPLIFKALDSVMDIYKIPALLFYFPSDIDHFLTQPKLSPNLAQKGLCFDKDIVSYPGCPDSSATSMQKMFEIIDEILIGTEKSGVISARDKLLSNVKVREYRDYLRSEYFKKAGSKTSDEMSPMSAVQIVPTEYLLNCLSRYESESYHVGELLRTRKQTAVYQVNAKFRGDPYPGALAAIDYIKCREGKTFEDRQYNLVLVFGKVIVDDQKKTIQIVDEKGSTISDFFNAVKSCAKHNLLTKNYCELQNVDIPRYLMQVRYGSTYSKVKHIRVFSYFADAILFPDGSLWRDA